MPKVSIKEWFKKPTTFRIILLIVGGTIFALLVDVFGLGTGSIGNFTFLQYAENFPKAGPFILLLFAPILASDNGIGTLSSKLGTTLNIGSVKPQLFKNTKYFYTLLSAVIILGAFTAFAIGIISFITNLLAPGPTRILNPMPFFVLPLLSISLSNVISSQLGSLLAFFCYKKKLDPDVWVYPTISTVNSVISTLFYALLIVIIQPKNWFDAETGAWITITSRFYLLFIAVLIYLSFISYILVRNIKSKVFWRIIRQAVPILSLTITINSLTGGILSRADEALVNLKGLFLVYPALIDTLADECTIIANTTSTDLALGAVETRFDIIKQKSVWTNVVGVGIAGIILHLFYGIVGSLIVVDIKRMWLVILLAISINIIGFLVVTTITYIMVIFSYKKGLESDVFAVPIILSITNLICSALILFFTAVVFKGYLAA